MVSVSNNPLNEYPNLRDHVIYDSCANGLANEIVRLSFNMFTLLTILELGSGGENCLLSIKIEKSKKIKNEYRYLYSNDLCESTTPFVSPLPALFFYVLCVE